jgi:arginyl-tRNA synthetase
VSNFHRYYHLGKLESKNRVITENRELSIARLWLVNTIGVLIKNALTLLGVSAPEKM